MERVAGEVDVSHLEIGDLDAFGIFLFVQLGAAREGRLPPGEGTLPLGALLDALPADTSLSVEMPMPALASRARIATASNSTKRLLDRQPRGTLRPGHRSEGSGQIQIRKA
jgi:hypothetical protein